MSSTGGLSRWKNQAARRMSRGKCASVELEGKLTYEGPRLVTNKVAEMTRRFDFAKAYYWQMDFVEPSDPDDDRYVVLYGEEGEVVGPLTVALAQTWMEHFSSRAQH
jgi:hypothetical protein